MDKFLTFEGKQPIWLDDINFMNGAVEKSLKHLADSLTGGQDCILWGVEPAVGEISEGAMCINGEILPVRRHEGITDSLTPVVRSAYSGTRTLKSGELKDCWEVRYVELVRDVDLPSYETYPRLLNLINQPTYESIYKASTAANPEIAITIAGGFINLAGKFIIPDQYVDGTPGLYKVANLSIPLPRGFRKRLSNGFRTPVVAVNSYGEPVYGHVTYREDVDSFVELEIQMLTTLGGEVSFNVTI